VQQFGDSAFKYIGISPHASLKNAAYCVCREKASLLISNSFIQMFAYRPAPKRLGWSIAILIRLVKN